MSCWRIKEALDTTIHSHQDNIDDLVEHKMISKGETKQYIFDRYKLQNLDRLQKDLIRTHLEAEFVQCKITLYII